MSAGTGRADVVRAIEATGVVAVIRLEDGALLRDVAFALAEGGVTALEVTMTVPRAVPLIAELAASPPPGSIVGAGTVLDAETARHELAIFAELERAPEHIHTYRITPLSLWNAAAAGMTAEAMIDALVREAV